MLPSTSAAAMRRRRSNSSFKTAMSQPGSVISGSTMAMFALGKCMRVVGVVAAVELLTHLPVIVFCFLTLVFASAAVMALQRPWKAAKRLSRQQWLRIFINGAFYGLVWILWAKGLQESGALRTIILEHSHVAFAALVGGCVQGLGRGAKGAVSARRRAQARGEVLFLAGFLLLFYHSVDLSQMPWLGIVLEQQISGEQVGSGDIGRDFEASFGDKGKDNTAATRSDTPVMDELGLAWGLVLLVASSLLGAVRDKFASKVAKDIGGAKRLHALSLTCCTLLLMPVVVMDFVGEAIVGVDYDYSVLSADTLFKAALVAILVPALHFYSTALSAAHINEAIGTVVSLVVSFACAYVLIHFDIVRDGSLLDHERYYTPLLLAWSLTTAGLWELLRHGGYGQNTGNGDFGGEAGASSFAGRPYGHVIYDSHDPPLRLFWRKFSQFVLGVDDLDAFFPRSAQLYYTSDSAASSSRSLASGGGSSSSLLGGSPGGSGSCSIAMLKRMYAHVMGSSDSRKIAIFLILNLLFMFVEILVGFWTNSLGLISDAGHMFFDAMALLIGLFASFVSKWKPDEYYTYGYTRYETICGFVNGVFLVFIAVFIMTESIERLSEPPELSTKGLLTTSILGFLVNMVGLVFFHDHAHMGSGEECSHGHSHGNENLHGVFLHILADALGSLGVIVSSLLIEFKGWYIADPLCSLMISVLILLSVYPLLKATSLSLILVGSPQQVKTFNEALREIMYLESVVGIREPHLFAQSQTTLVCSLHVITLDGADEQTVSRAAEEVIRKRLPLVRHLTVMAYQSSTFYDICQRCAIPVPLFWDYGTGALVPSQDGLITPEQKLQQQSQKRPDFNSHQIGSCGSGSHNHSHSHSHGHGHSHQSAHSNSGHSHQATHCNSSHSHDISHARSHHRQESVEVQIKDPAL